MATTSGQRVLVRNLVLLCAPLQLLAIAPWFEPNQGQVEGGVQFLSRSVYLESGKTAIRANGQTIILSLIDARRASPEALDPLSGVTNYYLGNDPKKWRTNVPHFARVRYHDVYPGINVTYYFDQQGRLEYDFNVAPHADPSAIRLAYNFPVRLDSNGDLLVAGIRQKHPKVFQDGREIASNYVTRSDNQVQLAIADYSRSAALTIDPVIEYSTYLGGAASDVIDAIAVDAGNNAFIAGSLESPKYPNLDPFRPSAGTAMYVAVAKFTSSGNALAFYSYVGGTGSNIAAGLALDAAGNAYVAGTTRTIDFPTKNAAQLASGGGVENAFVFKLSASGQLLYSTYLGGGNDESAGGIAVDATGAAFVSGTAFSPDFPVRNAIQPTMTGRPDAFVAKLSPAGDRFLFSTYLGGNDRDFGLGIALDANGNPIVTGSTSSTDFPVRNAIQTSLLGSGAGSPVNGFVTKMSAAGDKLVSSTYIGGTALVGLRYVSLDAAGAIYLAGRATGSGFPVKNPIQSDYGGGQQDVVIAKLAPTADSIVYASYLGGGDLDYPGALAVDRDGTAYLTGTTFSSDFPAKNSLQPWVGSTHSFKSDAFVARISPTGSLLYSTILGGNGDDRGSALAIDARGALHIGGGTNSDDFPIKNPIQSQFAGGEYDMFYVRFAPEAAPLPPLTASPLSLQFRFVIGGAVPPPQAVSVTSATPRLAFSPVSNATWLKVTASAGTTPASLTVSVDPSGLKPANYSGAIQIDSLTSVQVNLTVLAAPSPFFTAASITNAASFATGPVAPGEIVTIFGTDLDRNVIFDGVAATLVYFSPSQVSVTVPYSISGPATQIQVGTSTPVKLDVTPSAPGIFAGVRLPDRIVTLYATGCGVLTKDELPRCVLPVSVTVNGSAADVLYAGVAPTLVEGANQINIRLSDNFGSEPVTIVIKAGDTFSKPFVVQ